MKKKKTTNPNQPCYTTMDHWNALISHCSITLCQFMAIYSDSQIKFKKICIT